MPVATGIVLYDSPLKKPDTGLRFTRSFAVKLASPVAVSVATSVLAAVVDDVYSIVMPMIFLTGTPPNFWTPDGMVMSACVLPMLRMMLPWPSSVEKMYLEPVSMGVPSGAGAYRLRLMASDAEPYAASKSGVAGLIA